MRTLPTGGSHAEVDIPRRADRNGHETSRSTNADGRGFAQARNPRGDVLPIRVDVRRNRMPVLTRGFGGRLDAAHFAVATAHD